MEFTSIETTLHNVDKLYLVRQINYNSTTYGIHFCKLPPDFW